MSIMRIRYQITGPGGLPGLHTTFWKGAAAVPVAADAADVAGRVRAFWNSFAPQLANTVTVSPVGPADVLDEPTGQLLSQLAIGSPANVVGTGTGELPKATMVLLKYSTSIVINGRFLRGRSFIGPLGTGANTGGVVVAATNTALITASVFLGTGATASSHQVWHRPTQLSPSSGQASAVTSYGTNTEFSVLRSRRD